MDVLYEERRVFLIFSLLTFPVDINIFYAKQVVMSNDVQNDPISHLAKSCAIDQQSSKVLPGFPLHDAELRQTDNNAHIVPLPFVQPDASIAVSIKHVLQAMSVDGSDARHVSN